ncbi:MAG TPA: dTMP kinase, partial [Oceanospirillales bacterium]|nr:dTMP kinase [Oceanospirillales bacterium]
MKKGKFITLEGSEGAGKTTALNVIKNILDVWQVNYICTREPGGEATAEKIRDILLHSEHLHAKTELLLMFAARNEHLENVIKPNLAQGTWVISDRFVDASYAYQGGGRELGFEPIKWLDDFIVGNTQADL